MAEVLVALQAPPDHLEVAGWAEALTVYRETAGRTGAPARPGTPVRSGRPTRTRPRRLRLIPVPLGTRFAAAGAAAIAVLGGGVAASYADSLPGVLQNFAHETLGAPAAPGSQARPTPDASGRPAGPSVTGSAAYGLCNAYQHAEAHGTASQQAVAFRNLEDAAGGPDKVATFCASVPHPGPASPPGRRVGQARSTSVPGHHGKPTVPPGKPTAAPGKPTAPVGKPTTTPGNGKGQGSGTASASAKASVSGKGNGGGTSTGNANGNGSGN